MIKSAVVIPIGDISKFGYWKVAPITIASTARVFDRVLLVKTVRLTNLSDFMPSLPDNVEIWGSEETYLSKDGSSEDFNIYTLYRAVYSGFVYLAKGGFNVAVFAGLGMYIDNIQKAKASLLNFTQKNVPMDYYSKSIVLKNHVFKPNTRVPFLINLKFISEISFDVDVCIVGSKRYGWKGGAFGHHDLLSFRDILCYESYEERKEKHDWYIRSYSKDWLKIEIGSFNVRRDIKIIEKKINKIPVDYVLSRNHEAYLTDDSYFIEQVQGGQIFLYLVKGTIMRCLEMLGVLRFFGHR